MGIDQAFREAGIEIAFPQCDLHIRSVESAFPIKQVSNVTNGQPAKDSALSKGA